MLKAGTQQARGALLFVLGGLVGGLLNQWAVPSIIDLFKSTPLTRTELGLYQPLSYGRRLTSLRVTTTEAGSCEPESLDDIRNANAARCMTNRTIYDPCYSFSGLSAGESVVCVFAPWAHEANVVRVHRVDPSSFTPKALRRYRKRALPWALELENGLGCLFIGGGAGPPNILGRRINYECWRKNERPHPSGPRGVAAGAPDRSGAVWRIQFSKTNSTEFNEVSIRRVWF